jgi:hypothetical protein
MTGLDIFLFAAFIVLLTYLFWSLGRDSRAWFAAQEALENEKPGKGFEATSISPQIQSLRQNYITAVRVHRTFPCGRIERIATAKYAVSRRSFFQNLQKGIPPLVDQSHGECAGFEASKTCTGSRG